jgi:hypothetical protein
MFEGFSKRDPVSLIGGLIIVCGFSAWASIYIIENYVVGDKDDPIARAGGLKPGQMPK